MSLFAIWFEVKSCSTIHTRSHKRKTKDSFFFLYLFKPIASNNTMIFHLPATPMVFTFFAILEIYSIGLLFLAILGPHSHYSADAFQLHRCSYSCGRSQDAFRSFTILAAGQNEDTNYGCASNVKNNQPNIAKLWASSIEQQIPWHAGSQRYLADESSRSTPPKLVDETSETNEPPLKLP